MPAITLHFDQETNQRLCNLYLKINQELGEEKGEHKKEEIIELDKIPHISLLRVQDTFTPHTIKLVKDGLQKINDKKFQIEIHGVGVFKTGQDKYVLYFRPTYNTALQKIHQKIWNEFQDKVDLLEECYYSPNHYSLHITIHVKNMCKKSILKVMDYLMEHNIHFPATVDTVAFVHIEKETEKSVVFVEQKLQ